MANLKTSSSGIEYATIDTNPGANGFWTNIVSIRQPGADIRDLFFSIREATDSPSAASDITPILQFRCKGDAGWTDYRNGGTAFAIGDRVKIESNARGVEWRAGVELGGRTDGSIRLGFDW